MKRIRGLCATVKADLAPEEGLRAGSAGLCALMVAFLASTPVHAQLITASDAQGEYVRGRVLVGARAGLSDAQMQTILAPHRGRARAIGQSGVFIVDLPAQASEVAVLQQLARNPHFKFAELDRKVKSSYMVNDPYSASEWHLGKIGATAAWGTTQGAGVTVAIIDSGIDASHPDLSAQLVPGWNFVGGNSNTADVYGHGTAVAGTVAAVANNGIGVVGVAWQTRIMPVRVSDSSGWATYSAVAQGITYAADKGARVANASFQGTMASSSIVSAAQYMKSKNGLVFVSAGNQGTEEGYSATTSMIPVSATTSGDQLTGFSSWGSFVALSAPGEAIYTTQSGGGYWSCWGTSFSSPVAASVAALVMAAKPTLSSAQVESILFSTATDLGANGRDPQFGYGRVNASAAVQAALGSSMSPPDTTPPTLSIASPVAGSTVSGLVAVNVGALDNVGVAKVELRANGSVIGTDISSPYGFSWDSTQLPNGAASLVAYAYDAAGNLASSSTVTVNVSNNNQIVSDTTPPTVQILSPGGGSTGGVVTINGNLTISAAASDNSGTAGLTQTLYIDGAVKTSTMGGALTYKWNTRKVSAGLHTIQVVARDAAGNSASTSIQVTR